MASASIGFNWNCGMTCPPTGTATSAIGCRLSAIGQNCAAGGPKAKRLKPIADGIQRELPQEIPCHHRADDRPAVAERVDQLVEVFDLQSIIQGVPEAVREVKQRQHAQ